MIEKMKPKGDKIHTALVMLELEQHLVYQTAVPFCKDRYTEMEG